MTSSSRRRFSLGMAAGFVGTVWLMAQSAQELGDTEHRMIPFIEKFRSINESLKKFGRI
ncbi:MAG: hypothetical protein JWN63_861 [Candidatus Acidoferrum typicum]|jgi:hypothetical protein|nr:hypothetical protein [Candidatus Acidoferrum typicum]